MITYLFALAIVTAVGVIVGALMIRFELRRADRVFRAAREELDRLASTPSPALTSDAPQPTPE